MCAAEEEEDAKTGELLSGFKVVNFENMEEEELERTEGMMGVWTISMWFLKGMNNERKSKLDTKDRQFKTPKSYLKSTYCNFHGLQS